MASRVQLVITLDESNAEAGLKKVRTALDGMGATARTVTSEGTHGFRQLTGSITGGVFAANLIERALGNVFELMKRGLVESTLLAARSDVLKNVQSTLASQLGLSNRVLEAQVQQLRSLGIAQNDARQSILQFATSELDTADAIGIANVARDRAQLAGENVSQTMQRLTRAILAQEVELLKHVGIVIRQEEAFERYGRSIGKSANELNAMERRQAFVNEILRAGETTAGSYESAMQKVGKQLTSLPRLATDAAIALGTNFQTELGLGVKAVAEFLDFIEKNNDGIVTSTKLVVALTAAYIALKVAMSEAAVVNLIGFFSGLIPKLSSLAGGFTTLRLLLMGTGGATGFIGAFGLLAGAAGLVGFALGEVLGYFARSNIEAEEAVINFERIQKVWADAGVPLKDFNEANVLLGRLQLVNNERVKEGLAPLLIQHGILERLAEAEKLLKTATEDGTKALDERIKKLEALDKQLAQRQDQASLVGLSPEDRITETARREIADLIAQMERFPERAEAIKQTILSIELQAQIELNQIRVKAQDEASRTLLAALNKQEIAELDGIGRIHRAREEEVAKFWKIAERFPELRNLAARAEIAVVAGAEDEIRKIREKAMEETLKKRQAIEEQILALERGAALATLDAFQAIEFERRESIEKIENDVNASLEQIERARVAINATASERIRGENERIADEQLRNFERQGREYDRLLDRMVRFTEQTGSLIGNIWRALSEEFQRSVTKMVLGFIFGMGQIRGAAAPGPGGRQGGQGAASGGGVFGSILGGIFGGGPGGGTGGGVFNPAGGATPPFNANPFVTSAFGGSAGDSGLFRAGTLGPSPSGGGAGSIPGATSPGAGGGLLGGLLGPLGGLFSSPGRGGLGPALGLLLSLEGVKAGRPGLAAGLGIGGLLGGVALSGAAAGAAGGVGLLAGAGIGLAGFLTNPIGLAILGGLVGFSVIAGALGRGKKKEQATEIANRGFEEIDKVVKAFELRQLTFLQTVDSVSKLWDDMVGGWQKIGGSVGANSISSQRPFFDQKLRAIENIQAERNRRQDLIDKLPIPEFATGGYVGGYGSNPLLAAIHPGEFVMRRQAVESIGVPQLESLNSGRGNSGGGDTFNVSIHAMDSESFEGWARRNSRALQNVVVSAVKRDVKERGPVGRLVAR